MGANNSDKKRGNGQHLKTEVGLAKNQKSEKIDKSERIAKKHAKKPIRTPDGYHRLNFLNQAAQLINSSVSINPDLANKMNMHFGDVSQMVKDKYLIKVEPKRKRLECRRCHAQFSVKRKNVKYEIESKQNFDDELPSSGLGTLITTGCLKNTVFLKISYFGVKTVI